MSRRRPQHIQPRRPVYIGCEGRSEVGYASLLQDLIREANLAVHLHIDELGPGAGDPLSRVTLRIPGINRTGFRLISGQRSDLKPDSIPINYRT
ncbi:hypothetical protein ABIE33_006956, partial [Ensifer sp. 4252]